MFYCFACMYYYFVNLLKKKIYIANCLIRASRGLVSRSFSQDRFASVFYKFVNDIKHLKLTNEKLIFSKDNKFSVRF